MGVLSDRVRKVLGNGIPSSLFTCSKDGVPNVSYLSDVHRVDDDHIALSNQFFNKSKRNLSENPQASVWLMDFEGPGHWVLDLIFDRTETDGPVFDEMESHLSMIASAQGMEDVFVLKGADIYRVLSCEHILLGDG
jgi:predicted pyridoxine 5'-phosphate oxidase superfamily flavin-nucleotide-binding protein